MENTNDVAVKIEKVQMSPDEIQRIKSEAEGEFLFKETHEAMDLNVYPYRKNATGEWEKESDKKLIGYDLNSAFYYIGTIVSRNGHLGVVSRHHATDAYDYMSYIRPTVFERNSSSETFKKISLYDFELEEDAIPEGFSTVLAVDGSFFLMTYDGQALLRWFKDSTGTWTSEIIESSDKEDYKHPALAQDESYFLTTTDNNDINIWEREAEGKWRQSSAPLHSPQTIDAFYIAPNSKYFITVNKTSRTAVFWSRNSQGQWENQTFDGVDGGINKYKNLNTPQVAFANDSKSFVITGLNEEGGYRIS
jgi:hypothetical protein